MPIILRARCHVLHPSHRIERAHFDVEPASEPLGEYVLMNLVRERGLLLDGKMYRITIDPFFPHTKEG